MTKTKTESQTKPEYLKALRDAAAVFVHAIDRTQFEYGDAATSELKERAECLIALNDLEKTEPEMVKTPTEVLRKRVNLLGQVNKAQHAADYGIRELSNHALEKRIGLLTLAARLEFGNFTDEQLDELGAEIANNMRTRNRLAAAQAKAEARAAA